MEGDSSVRTLSTIWSLLLLLLLNVGLEGWGPKSWAWVRFKETRVGRTTLGSVEIKTSESEGDRDALDTVTL